jgi:hypothetical protein
MRKGLILVLAAGAAWWFFSRKKTVGEEGYTGASTDKIGALDINGKTPVVRVTSSVGPSPNTTTTIGTIYSTLVLATPRVEVSRRTVFGITTVRYSDGSSERFV